MKQITSPHAVHFLPRKLPNPAGWCLAAMILLGLAAAPLQAATTTVHIFDFDFSTNPSGQPIVDPTINVGDTIQWTWDTGFHSTTAAAGQAETWDSGVVGPGSTFDHIFNSVGTFNYYCIPHGSDLGGGNVGGMSGSITVVPEPGAWSLGLMALALTRVIWACRRGARHDWQQI